MLITGTAEGMSQERILQEMRKLEEKHEERRQALLVSTTTVSLL